MLEKFRLMSLDSLFQGGAEAITMRPVFDNGFRIGVAIGQKFRIGNRQCRRHQAIEQAFLIGSSATDTQKSHAVLLGDFCRYFPQKGRAQTDDGQI